MYSKGYVLLCRISNFRFESEELFSRSNLEKNKWIAQFVLMSAGFTLLTLAVNDPAFAAPSFDGTDNGDKILSATQMILGQIEGAFGALVMVCSGVGAIISAAFGQYRAALGLMVVAIGSFILRTLVQIFFNVPELANPS